jgi:hypothetical protein
MDPEAVPLLVFLPHKSTLIICGKKDDPMTAMSRDVGDPPSLFAYFAPFAVKVFAF